MSTVNLGSAAGHVTRFPRQANVVEAVRKNDSSGAHDIINRSVSLKASVNKYLLSAEVTASSF